MPFSSGRSVRAPASKATRIVVERAPSRATRWTGRPLGAVEEVIFGIGAPGYSAAARELRGDAVEHALQAALEAPVGVAVAGEVARVGRRPRCARR